VITSIGYAIASGIVLRNHMKKIRELFSENDKTELKWLQGLSLVFLLMIVFFVIIHIMKNEKVDENSLLVTLSYLMFAGFFWYLGLNGFRQKEIYNAKELAEINELDSSPRISKKAIEEHLIKTKSYLKPEFNVFDLCYHFHTNRTYLSESIRINFDMNFRGLINHYRIIEAKTRIENSVENNETPDLEKLAISCGFSSYSTFFRVFKSEIGITPSDYIKNIQNK
jgi:AraC-like DNA-binding protein